LTRWLSRLWVAWIRVTGRWMLGTRLEPLATGRKAASVASDADFTQEWLDALDAQLTEYATFWTRWIGAFAVGLGVLRIGDFASAKLLDTLGRQLIDDSERFWSVVHVVWVGWLGVGTLAFLAWLVWHALVLVHLGRQPAYTMADRMTLALMSGNLAPETMLRLQTIPADALLRVYWKGLIPPLPRSAT